MNREHEHEELIELGVASVETKGLTAGKDDHQVGLIPFEGLGDE
jgi:hypothetical protein